MQFFRLQWGEHPIERGCQKRQCLFSKNFIANSILLNPCKIAMLLMFISGE
jgi:hypothetical protein